MVGSWTYKYYYKEIRDSISEFLLNIKVQIITVVFIVIFYKTVFCNHSKWTIITIIIFWILILIIIMNISIPHPLPVILKVTICANTHHTYQHAHTDQTCRVHHNFFMYNALNLTFIRTHFTSVIYLHFYFWPKTRHIIRLLYTWHVLMLMLEAPI